MRASERREDSGGGLPDPQASPRAGRLWSVIVTVALAGVVAMIVVGALALCTDRRDLGATTRGGSAPTRGATSEHPMPDPQGRPDASDIENATSLPDVSFVDVRTGRTRPLPRSIRSVGAWVGQFQPSPSGRRLAFTDGSRVYVATVDGRHIRAVTDGPYASGPSWSPDGRRIVFAAEGRGWIVRLATGEVRRVIGGHDQIYRPTFTPEGRTVLFSRAHGAALALWVAPGSGGTPTLFMERAAFGAYSPDGSAIALRRTSFDGSVITEMTQERLWIASADGSALRGLGPNRAWASQGDAQALWPVWSPDGSLIAYERLYQEGVIVVDVATGRVIARIDGTDPGWLDDDTLIISKGDEA